MPTNESKTFTDRKLAALVAEMDASKKDLLAALKAGSTPAQRAAASDRAQAASDAFTAYRDLLREQPEK